MAAREKYFRFRASDEDLEILSRLEKATGMNRSAIIRLLIRIVAITPANLVNEHKEITHANDHQESAE